MPVDVGSGGEDDVNVVASRVGLNLRAVGFDRKVGSTRRQCKNGEDVIWTDRPLLYEAIIPEVFEHRLLSGTEILYGVVLERWNSGFNTPEGQFSGATHLTQLCRGQHQQKTEDLDEVHLSFLKRQCAEHTESGQ